MNTLRVQAVYSTRWLMSKKGARGVTCREDNEAAAREGGESWMALTLDL